MVSATPVIFSAYLTICKIFIALFISLLKILTSVHLHIPSKVSSHNISGGSMISTNWYDYSLKYWPGSALKMRGRRQSPGEHLMCSTDRFYTPGLTTSVRCQRVPAEGSLPALPPPIVRNEWNTETRWSEGSKREADDPIEFSSRIGSLPLEWLFRIMLAKSLCLMTWEEQVRYDLC